MKYTVIIPTYNSERFIEEALNSVLMQNVRDVEVIIVDNNSTDSTIALASKYISDIPLKIIPVKNNGSIALSRNLGMRYARGEYVCFLDSDDCWEANKLTKVGGLLEHQAFDLCVHPLSTNFDSNQYCRWVCSLEFRPKYLKNYSSLVEAGPCVTLSSLVVRKKFLNDNNIFFDEEVALRGIEDYLFVCSICKKSPCIVHLPIILGRYRVHNTQTSKQSKMTKRLMFREAAKKLGFGIWSGNVPGWLLFGYIRSYVKNVRSLYVVIVLLHRRRLALSLIHVIIRKCFSTCFSRSKTI